MKIAGHEVEIKKDHIRVGCTTVTLDVMRELVRKVEQYKDEVADIYEVFNCVSSQKEHNSISCISECIELIRDLGHLNFMGVRKIGNYHEKGFFWVINHHQ